MNNTGIDKKYIIAVASAAAIISAAAIYMLRKRKQKKEDKKEEPPKEEPKPIVSPVPKDTSDDVDFSNVTNVDDVISMAMKYTATFDFKRGIKMVGMKDIEKRKMLFNARANLYVSLNKPDSAISDFTECINLAPLDCKAYLNRAKAYGMKNQEEKMFYDYTVYTLLEEDITKIPEQIHNDMSLMQKSIGYRLAEQEIEKRKEDPKYKFPFPPKAQIRSFFGYFLSEKSSEYNHENWTLITITEKINNYTTSPDTTYSLGDLYLMRGGILKAAGYYKEACSDFKNACEEQNHCANLFDAKLEYATFLTLIGDHTQADALFQDLMENGDKMSSNPNWINLYAKYSTSLASTNKEEAMRIANELVEKYPNDADSHLAKGSVAYMCRKTDEAVKELNESIKIHPSVCAYMHLTMCCGKDTDAAISMIKEAYKLAPTNSEVLNAYGDLLMMKGSFLSANDRYEEAMRAEPNNAMAYVNLASLKVRISKDAPGAVVLLKKALEKDNTCIQGYIVLIQVLSVMNKRDQIYKVIEKALEYAVELDDVAEVMGYKYAIEEALKCNDYIEQLRAKK